MEFNNTTHAKMEVTTEGVIITVKDNAPINSWENVVMNSSHQFYFNTMEAAKSKGFELKKVFIIDSNNNILFQTEIKDVK
ncbi:hypothetical protein QUF88_15855 [Bacillus sp. DX1.1]|uniref:hypothetical protein n=1 Tax=unclassified Bacillus (in: firmicutes) TaxID=185979 RepID=UPI0025700CD9|nr:MULTISPECIES: hypothetical protein [unclassified Bacillus (in: firmicutes)]MDM5155227.1 hypothetical protein [Bacillus sp. DX1.1]WJE79546.1 hypothetical protein QRE67_13350 [Bacillus sp. DX3.1]